MTATCSIGDGVLSLAGKYDVRDPADIPKNLVRPFRRPCHLRANDERDRDDEEGRQVSNRTVAILASIMAAVSFVYESVAVSLTIESPHRAAVAAQSGDDATR